MSNIAGEITSPVSASYTWSAAGSNWTVTAVGSGAAAVATGSGTGTVSGASATAKSTSGAVKVGSGVIGGALAVALGVIL